MMSDERQRMYDELNGVTSTEQDGAVEETVEKTETTEQGSAPADDTEKTAEGLADTTQDEAEATASDDAVGEKPKEKGDLKSALKEERIKRRQLKAEYEAKLADKEKQLNEFLQTLRSAGEPNADESETIMDYEKTLKNLNDKIKDIEIWKRSQTIQAEEEQKRAQYQTLMSRIEKTDSELNKQGIPGFAKFKALVSEELNQMSPDERAEMDNEEGWMEIYTEKIFPTIKGAFSTMTKEQKVAEKIKAKEGMSMLGETKGEQKPKKSDDWTTEDYFAMRMKGQSYRPTP